MATPRQRLAIKKVLQGTTLEQAMIEANYASSTAASTGKLTRSKAWEELTEKTISDRALLKVHKEGLSATKPMFTPEGELIHPEDYATRHKYLETGYKIRGKLKEQNGNTNIFIENLRIEQQRRLADEIIRLTTGSDGSFNSVPNSDEPAI